MVFYLKKDVSITSKSGVDFLFLLISTVWYACRLSSLYLAVLVDQDSHFTSILLCCPCSTLCMVVVAVLFIFHTTLGMERAYYYKCSNLYPVCMAQSQLHMLRFLHSQSSGCHVTSIFLEYMSPLCIPLLNPGYRRWTMTGIE